MCHQIKGDWSIFSHICACAHINTHRDHVFIRLLPSPLVFSSFLHWLLYKSFCGKQILKVILAFPKPVTDMIRGQGLASTSKLAGFKHNLHQPQQTTKEPNTVRRVCLCVSVCTHACVEHIDVQDGWVNSVSGYSRATKKTNFLCVLTDYLMETT